MRKALLEKRKKISHEQARLAAEHAASLFEAWPIFQASKHIASYFSVASEFSTRPLIQSIWRARKHAYLPIVEGEKLIFSEYQSQDQLTLNVYSIFEPSTRNLRCSPQDFDIVLLPLLGFDRCGNRLGSGGGYYDKTFADVNLLQKRPFLLGVGYGVQEVDALSADSWDIKLDGILTETELIVVSEKF